MKPFVQVADQYYVLAATVSADHESRVLKQGETFAIFDSYGDILSMINAEAGIFHRGTRYLSHFEFTVFGGLRPILLNSTLRDDNGLLKIDMTNRDLTLPQTPSASQFIAKGTLYIHREKFLLDSVCHERVAISNYGSTDVTIDVGYRIGADFNDIFEVRGNQRKQKGQLKPLQRDNKRVIVGYLGLDGISRQTTFELSIEEFNFDGSMVSFELLVAARSTVCFETKLIFSEQERLDSNLTHFQALERVHADHQSGRTAYCTINSSNEQFDTWLRRSTDDLITMTTATPEGALYPYAGIPWYCCPFGRDGIITAIECLWANPSLARGVLEYLAETQAHERIPTQDSTPGKIIHETRFGEMAALNEIPFGRYYGSVDSTPLFIALAGLYITRTGDLQTLTKLWPAIEKALHWLDRYGDLDGDGFVEYQREHPSGLIHQGWKDSHDSVFHSDGSDAQGPIALSEVQAYVYLAKIEGAKLAQIQGHGDFSDALRLQAQELRDKFDRFFWLEDLGTFAIALDGNKKPCRVASSNAGQCLFTGIVKPERIEALTKTLMRAESFSGWGIRTAASDACRYNPMSYHNGSIWPHDCAIISLGLAQLGCKPEAERIFNGLFRAAVYMENMRMPEVFCGFHRREGEAPTLYPNACSPQAWAAGSVYLLLQALLGLSIDAVKKNVTFFRPRLPESIETLRIFALQVGDETIDLIAENHQSDVSIQILRRSAGITVMVEK